MRAGILEISLIVLGLAVGYATLSFFDLNRAPTLQPALIGPAALPTPTVAPAVTPTTAPPTPRAVATVVVATAAFSPTPEAVPDTPAPTPPAFPTAALPSATVAPTIKPVPSSATPAPPVPSPTPTQVVYVVKTGDTLTHIAQLFGVSANAIAQANQLSNPDQLSEGQRLIIPPG